MEQLPKDVLENVLSRLSVYDIVRTGSSCKTLRALVASQTFTSSQPSVGLLLLHPVCSDLPPSPAWAYDADRDAWITLSLEFLQPNRPVFAYPVATDDGLICFGLGRDFIVCNPITNTWRRLPCLAQAGQQYEEDCEQAFGLKYKPASGTYDLFVLNHCTSEQPGVSRLTKFCSSMSQWSSMPSFFMPDGYRLWSNAIVFCNSTLYTLWQRGGFLMILAYNDGRWTEVEAPGCSAKLLKAFLMDVRGSLHMVGGVGAVWLQGNVWVRPTSVRIWKLLAQGNAWVEVARMPLQILHEFCRRIDFEELQCCGKNGVLYMKSQGSDVLMFDLSMNQWKWTKDLERSVYSLLHIFEPSFLARA